MIIVPFTPIEGEVYQLPYGGKYKCICVLDRYQNNAVMRNIQSGWTITANHVKLREDGKIEWDYSSGGTFT